MAIELALKSASLSLSPAPSVKGYKFLISTCKKGIWCDDTIIIEIDNAEKCDRLYPFVITFM